MAFTTPSIKTLLDGFLALTVLLMLVASYGGWISPVRQGFHCNDPDLGYQYHGDTIAFSCVAAVTIITPACFIILIEMRRHQPCQSLHKTSDVDPSTTKQKRLRTFWKCCLQVYGIYLHGLACVSALQEVLKLSIGGLRPHFFDSCKPDFTAINCSQGYIIDYHCTNEANLSSKAYTELFKSFPSGHATISMYMSLFLCCYIYKQIFPWPTHLSTAMLQTSLLYWAGYCSVSRVLDHRHHWWDVLAGAILGISYALYSASWLWLDPLPCSTEVVSSSKNSLFSLGHDCNTKNRAPRRMLLSSQASQTTELGESLSFQNNVQETYHDLV